MSAVACIISLIAASMCMAYGVVRIGTWLIDARERSASRRVREAAFFAQARAEISDRDYSVAMLDQESMGEGWS